METRRNKIIALLRDQHYEAAFTKAESACTADLVIFTCRISDLNEVLGGMTPILSQYILLCLRQQLGTVLSAPSINTSSSIGSSLKLEMEWLQEIAMSLNPADPSIHRHIAGVFNKWSTTSIKNLKWVLFTSCGCFRYFGLI